MEVSQLRKLQFLIVLSFFMCSVLIFSETFLFINSTPGSAEISIDGLQISQKTPALLRNLSTGDHRIILSKPGYIADITSVNLKDNDVKILSANLEYQFIPLIFPVQNDIRINGRNNNDDMFLLKNGDYNFNMNPDILNILPIYPGQKLINGLNISIPILSVFSGALTVNEIYNSHGSDGSLSTFALSSIGVTAVMIIADIILYILRDKYNEEKSIPIVPKESDSPNILFSTAEEMVLAGKIDTAMYYLNKIIDNYPNSDIYPNAVYKSAKLQIIEGEIDSAQLLLNILVQDYPLPSFYNSAIKTLSDISRWKEEYQESLESLDLIIYMESGFTREEIDLQRYKILNKWYEADSTKYNQLKIHLGKMVQLYTNSSFYDLYVEMLSGLSQNEFIGKQNSD